MATPVQDPPEDWEDPDDKDNNDDNSKLHNKNWFEPSDISPLGDDYSSDSTDLPHPGLRPRYGNTRFRYDEGISENLLEMAVRNMGNLTDQQKAMVLENMFKQSELRHAQSMQLKAQDFEYRRKDRYTTFFIRAGYFALVLIGIYVVITLLNGTLGEDGFMQEFGKELMRTATEFFRIFSSPEPVLQNY